MTSDNLKEQLPGSTFKVIIFWLCGCICIKKKLLFLTSKAFSTFCHWTKLLACVVLYGCESLYIIYILYFPLKCKIQGDSSILLWRANVKVGGLNLWSSVSVGILFVSFFFPVFSCCSTGFLVDSWGKLIWDLGQGVSGFLLLLLVESFSLSEQGLLSEASLLWLNSSSARGGQSELRPWRLLEEMMSLVSQQKSICEIVLNLWKEVNVSLSCFIRNVFFSTQLMLHLPTVTAY